jgi:predicted PurR-regulated permease PerM
MIITITILSVLLLGIILGLIYTIIHISKIIDELKSISEEQHTQNVDIMDLIKKTHNYQVEQHKFNIEVAQTLQYFADKDLIKELNILDKGKIGQA